jgi:hypothetical protein
MRLSPSVFGSGSAEKSKVGIRRVTLRGAPFRNPHTVKELVRDCVPKLSDEDAQMVIERAQEKPHEDVTVIVCLEEDANIYCRRLVENGLLSEVS